MPIKLASLPTRGRGLKQQWSRAHWTVALVAPQATPQVVPQVGELLASMRGEMSREALQSALGLRDRKSFRERYLNPALADGLIEMTVPGKPNSRLQKYRLSGRAANGWRSMERADGGASRGPSAENAGHRFCARRRNLELPARGEILAGRLFPGVCAARVGQR